MRGEQGRFGNVPPLYCIRLGRSRRWAGTAVYRPDLLNMMAFTRWVIRAVLGVVVLVVAFSALVAISLFAMYWDWRCVEST